MNATDRTMRLRARAMASGPSADPNGAPTGGIYSNAVDLCKRVAMHLNSGRYDGSQIISEARLKDIHYPHLPVTGVLGHDELSSYSVTLGFGLSAYRGRPFYVADGTQPGHNARVLWLPKDDYGFVILYNRDTANSPDARPFCSIITYGILDRLLGLRPVNWNRRFRARPKRRPAARPAEGKAGQGRGKRSSPPYPLRSYAGTYRHGAYGTMVLKVQRGGLHVKLNFLKCHVQHSTNNVFGRFHSLFGPVKLAFRANRAGSITSVAVAVEGDEVVFRKIEAKPE